MFTASLEIETRSVPFPRRYRNTEALPRPCWPRTRRARLRHAAEIRLATIAPIGLHEDPRLRREVLDNTGAGIGTTSPERLHLRGRKPGRSMLAAHIGLLHAAAMTSLSTLRRSLARAPWMRGLAALLILSLLVGTSPRWQLHAHDGGNLPHAHTHAATIDDYNSLAPLDGDASLAALHLHDVANPAGAPASSLNLGIVAIPACNWHAPIELPPATLAAGPPPQRPPIV